MPKYLSGRAKRVPQDQLSEDRYKYLALDQAEPNLSDPLVIDLVHIFASAIPQTLSFGCKR